jgi:hypothetical protein
MKMKPFTSLSGLAVAAFLMTTASAQVITVYSPIIGPAPVPAYFAPQTIVARPVVSTVTVPPVQVVTAYRPATQNYVAPATVYPPIYSSYSVPIAEQSPETQCVLVCDSESDIYEHCPSTPMTKFAPS